MKRFLFLILPCIVQIVYAQKPPVDSAAMSVMPGMYSESISNDGAYVSYHLFNEPPGKKLFCIRSVNGQWKKDLENIYSPSFSEDGHSLVYKIGDSLCLLTLGTDKTVFISKVIFHSLKNNWLAYRPATDKNRLIIRNILNNHERSFADVSDYFFSPDGKTILLSIKKDSLQNTVLQLLNLQTGKIKTIWTASELTEQPAAMVLKSGEKNKIVFISGRKLWYYDSGKKSAAVLVDQESLLPGNLEFSVNGNLIFYQLEKKDSLALKKTGAAAVDIWSYRDIQLQSRRTSGLNKSWYTFAYNLNTKQVIQITQDDETINAKTSEYALVKNAPGGLYGAFEMFWNKETRPSFFLVSLKDGSRKLIRGPVSHDPESPGLSPEGKWLIYYDYDQKNFFSYETATGTIRNMTGAAKTEWEDLSDEYPVHGLNWVPWVNSWTANDESVFMSDGYDIWQSDPAGKKPPVCITNGYGKKHKVRLSLLFVNDLQKSWLDSKKTILVLRAINEKTKDRGFYTVIPGTATDPDPCGMGAYVYGDWAGEGEYNYPPIKAKNNNVFLVTRMTATEAPNYFTTSDFKTFHQLTNLDPTRNINWLTTALIRWKTLDGDSCYGILYKPENFDPTKKYPVIFNYYQIRSTELNLYLYPGYSTSHINIPWFVSNGYLVFVPDIHYKTGEPGQGALNSIVSAAEYLSSKPWVDAKHMGLQGHSFGGYETNYVITHSNLFAAACSASGPSDLASLYFSDAPGIYPMRWAETGQGRMSEPPWKIPDTYVKNSPVFFADKVTTPLLMMNNKDDVSVPFTQGFEFFAALRRLGKPVWLLQYDGEGHSVGWDHAKDYHTRMLEFFDRYLKDKSAPQWMSDPDQRANK